MSSVDEKLGMIKDELLKILDRIVDLKKKKFCMNPDTTCMICENRLVCLHIYQTLDTCEGMLTSCLMTLDQIKKLEAKNLNIM